MPPDPGEQFSALGPEQCYASLSDATAVATGDPSYASVPASEIMTRLRSTKDHPTALSKIRPNGTISGSGNDLLGIDFKDTHYNAGETNGGDTIQWYSPLYCTSTQGLQVGNMPSGWNDEVSSATSFEDSNCGGWTHYQNSNFGGATINCGYNMPGSGGCYNMETYASNGNMNDQTSSEKWAVMGKIVIMSAYKSR